MIKISSLNKYYNYKKSNQVQANKEISLDFNDKGYILITGDSGSGKTTLLNCIAGIDTFEQGSITVDNIDYSAKDISKLDDYRRNNIGIIFQDYKLIEDKTVEENLIFALKVSSKSIDYQIIDDTLAQVGMANYNARKINTLSGGQKQRVAIARALIVQPKIILADEPTGNLDNDNSIEIMNLLKHISKEYLVLIVSHDEPLLNPLADRIIKINDGIIIEDINKESVDEIFIDKKALVYKEEYNQASLPNNDFNIFYKKDSITNIEIYFDNNKIYIKSLDKYEVSNITNEEIRESKITNTSKKSTVPHQELSKEVFNNTITRNYKSNNLLKNVFTLTKWKINAIICLIFASLFMVLSMGFLSSTEIKPISYQRSANNLISLEYYDSNYKLENFLTFNQEEESVISFIPYIENTNMTVIQDSLPQFYGSQNNNNINIEYTTLHDISDKDVLIGKYPECSNEILIDKMYIDSIFDDSTILADNFSIDNYSGFINLNLYFDNTLDDFSMLKIVGVVDKGAPVLYIDVNKIYSLFSQKLGDGQQILTELNSEMYTSEIVFNNEYDIYLNQNDYYRLDYHEGNSEPYKCLDKNFTVVGSFVPSENNTENTCIIPSDTLKRLVLDNYVQRYNTIYVLTNYKSQTLEYFNDQHNYNVQKAYAHDPVLKQYDSYLKEQQHTIGIQISMTIAIILIAFIIIFFFTQSELSRNLSSIIVARLLGESKRKLVLRIFKENISFLLIIIIPLYLFFSVFINYIASIGIITIISNINYLFLSLGLLIQLFISALAAIIPIMRIVNKTPIKLFTSNV